MVRATRALLFESFAAELWRYTDNDPKKSDHLVLSAPTL